MILESVLIACTILNSVTYYLSIERPKTVIAATINNANNNAKDLRTKQGVDSGSSERTNAVIAKSQNTICSLFNTIKNNPIASTVIASSVALAWIHYVINNGNALLKNPESWCNWKYDSKLDDAALIKKLHQDICTKYLLICDSATNNHITQLFLNDIKKEILCLENYLFWQKKLSSIGLNTIFSLQHPDYFAESKQAYLKFLLKLLMQDLAEKQHFW